MERTRTTIILGSLLLAACGSPEPEAPPRNQLVEEARSAMAEIPAKDVQSLDVRIALARGYSDSDQGESAQALLDGADAGIDTWSDAYGPSYKPLARARVSVERASLGIGGPLSVETELSRFNEVPEGEQSALAYIEAARLYAEAGIDDIAVAMLDEATRSTAEVPALARRAWHYRQLLAEYKKAGASEQMAEILYRAEEAAWLEEDASQQPVAMMRLAAVYAELGRNDEAEAIKAALPENYHHEIDGAVAVAMAVQGDVDGARNAASAITHPMARALAYLGILQQPQAAGVKESIVAGAADALAASDENSRSVQYYALAAALLPEHPDSAAERLQTAVNLNTEAGRFWNFNEFSDATVALANVGALTEAQALAAQVGDDAQRQQLDAKLTAVAARLAVRNGDANTAREVAMSLEDPAARAIALAGVLEEMK